MEQTVLEFIAHIRTETLVAVGRIGAILSNKGIVTIGCFDPLALFSQGKWHAAIPGGGMFLFYHGYLENWFEHRRGMSGIIGVHKHCGFMFAVMNLETLAQHLQAIAEFVAEVERLNILYDAHFTVEVGEEGAAMVHMTG